MCIRDRSDTVGFIAKLPHHLIEAFQATLEELQYADLLLHVIDASDPHREAHIEVVDRLIDKLAKPGVPVLRCYNKADLVGDVSNLPIGEKNIPMCCLLYTSERLWQPQVWENHRKNDSGTWRSQWHAATKACAVDDTARKSASAQGAH